MLTFHQKVIVSVCVLVCMYCIVLYYIIILIIITTTTTNTTGGPKDLLGVWDEVDNGIKWPDNNLWKKK